MPQRRVFYSFHYEADNWRAAQIRNMGVVEGNMPARDNDWESIKKGGDYAIKRWINGQLQNRSCTIVLIGTETAKRKWINYEIEESWRNNKGLMGIYVHNMKDRYGKQSRRGPNPFEYCTIKERNIRLSDVVPVYEPQLFDSNALYSYIKLNLATWIEQAIRIRHEYA